MKTFIPSGLIDGNFELFSDRQIKENGGLLKFKLPIELRLEILEGRIKRADVYAFYEGKHITFNEMPSWIRIIFLNEMQQNEAFMKKYKGMNAYCLLKLYMIQNYGLLNDIPDLNILTGITSKETDPLSILSVREREIAPMLISGTPLKSLGLNLNTLKRHMTNIYNKFNISSSKELAQILLG